jgi:hypothetical protein
VGVFVDMNCAGRMGFGNGVLRKAGTYTNKDLALASGWSLDLFFSIFGKYICTRESRQISRNSVYLDHYNESIYSY